MIVGGWTYLLVSVWVYLSDKPPAPPTATELSLGKIRTERAALGREHPWAGRYETHDQTLELSPESGYVFRQFYHGVEHDAERGYFREADGILFAPQSEDRGFRRGLLPVRWGRRRYLISKDELKEFANRINQGGEPRYDVPGFFLLRAGDEGVPADGFPVLPEPERGLLLEKPLDATIVKVGLDHVRPEESAASDGDRDTTIILGVGRKQGARPGMVLHPEGGHWGDAEIKSVNELSSLAIFHRRSGDASPKAGWKLSTRYRSHRGFTQADAALQVTVSTLTRAAPFTGRIKTLEGAGYLAEAKNNGFSVRLTARISVRSVDQKLRDAAATDETAAGLARSTGGNALLETRRSERESGPRKHTKTLAAYRVEWRGQPLAADEFPYAWDSTEPDWGRAKREIERARHPYARAVDRIYSEAAERLLRLPPGGWDALARLDVEDLTAEQRAAFQKFWGLAGTYGTIRGARRTPEAYDTWRKAHDEAAAPALSALKQSDPLGDAEYRRLSAAIR